MKSGSKPVHSTRHPRISEDLPANGRVNRPRAGSPSVSKRFGKTPDLAHTIGKRLARQLQESFPAPNPDVVRVRQVRKLTTGKWQCYGINLPPEIMYCAGIRLGDQVMIRAWAEGIVQIFRIAEGE